MHKGRSFQKLVKALPEVLNDEWSKKFDTYFDNTIMKVIGERLRADKMEQEGAEEDIGLADFFSKDVAEQSSPNCETPTSAGFLGPLLIRSLRVPSVQEDAPKPITEKPARFKKPTSSKQTEIAQDLMLKVSTQKLMDSTAVKVVLDVIEIVWSAKCKGLNFESGEFDLSSFDAEQRDGNSWNDLFQLLTSPLTYSSSIYDM